MTLNSFTEFSLYLIPPAEFRLSVNKQQSIQIQIEYIFNLIFYTRLVQLSLELNKQINLPPKSVSFKKHKAIQNKEIDFQPNSKRH